MPKGWRNWLVLELVELVLLEAHASLTKEPRIYGLDLHGESAKRHKVKIATRVEGVTGLSTTGSQKHFYIRMLFV